MKIKSYIILLILTLNSCNTDLYEYQGQKYKWHHSLSKESKFSSIYALDLANNNLESIPSEVFTLPNLKFLNLRNNQLTIIDEKLYDLKNLTSLFIAENNLKVLDPDISKLENLEVLDIHRCNLDTLPNALFELKGLRYLMLGGNNFGLEQIELLKLKLPNCKVIDSVD